MTNASRITIAPTADRLLRGDKPFFFCADTVWSAFTNPTLTQWRTYLAKRRSQGFNVLQIDILPQWDRTPLAPQAMPYAVNPDGRADFARRNDTYFSRAAEMLMMAAAEGFTPALVLLWNDYLPGSWASRIAPGHTMSAAEIRSYVEHAVSTFAPYHPIYFVSGDTGFNSDEEKAGYQLALELVKTHSPRAITALHLKPKVELPPEFIHSSLLDLYIYQSGHMAGSQDNSYTLAAQALGYPVKRPIINSEPCYEGHAHGRAYGRFSATEVRRSVWQSLLSGASAGIAYGAHGVWCWHEHGAPPYPGVKFGGAPQPWVDAVEFRGAWDVGFARWLFETYELFDLQPAALVSEPATPEICAGTSPDGAKIAAYLPYNFPVRVSRDLRSYEVVVIELTTRHVIRPHLQYADNATTIDANPITADSLVIAVRR
jgi:hypothetical protein